MSKSLSAKYLSANVYQKIKKGCKKTRKRYQNLSNKEKGKKPQYGRERYKDFSEDEKQKLVEYRKYYKMRKNAL